MTDKKDYKEIEIKFIAYESDNVLLGSASQSSSSPIDPEESNWTPFF